MIFVDTSAWYARYTPRDPNHQAARSFHRANREPLVTTDFIVDETLTLFKARGNYQRALHFGPRLLSGNAAAIIWVERSDFEAAWDVFSHYRDKEWSFTDCVSYIVMKRMGISDAFAFDTHFEQFGVVNVLP